jgi:hypothetical protein
MQLQFQLIVALCGSCAQQQAATQTNILEGEIVTKEAAVSSFAENGLQDSPKQLQWHGSG